MFDYEICLFPPAQAESVDYLNELQKATFAEAIWNNATKTDVTISRQIEYIIEELCFIASHGAIELHLHTS